MSMEQFINAIFDREEMKNEYDDYYDDYYYDDDYDGNMPCDISGFCAGSSCPAWWRCQGK